MPTSPDIIIHTDYKHPIQITGQAVVRAMRGRVTLPDEFTYSDTLFQAEINMPDGNVIDIRLNTDYATLDPDPQAMDEEALLPLGAVATIIRNRNDRRLGKMIAEFEELPLSLQITSAIPDTGVIVEFPQGAKTDAQCDGTGVTYYIDKNVAPNDPNSLPGSTTVFIPLSRAYMLGDAQITVRRGL